MIILALTYKLPLYIKSLLTWYSWVVNSVASPCIEHIKCWLGVFCRVCVSNVEAILLIIFYAIYGTVCFQLGHLSFDDYENSCASSYHHQIGSNMSHQPLFRVRSWNNDMHYMSCYALIALRWRHNGRDSVSNHQPHDCLLNRLFRRRSKKTSKLRVTGLCAVNSPGWWIHCTNGQLRGKCFHLMTSSWAGVSSHCDKRLCMFIMIAIICTTKIILTCSTI